MYNPMAVTMVIGNNPQTSWSLFAPQYTMAAVIANEFKEAVADLHLHALVEIGLVLFIITLVVNVVSRLLIWRMTATRTRRPAPDSRSRWWCRPGRTPPTGRRPAWA